MRLVYSYIILEEKKRNKGVINFIKTFYKLKTYNIILY